MRKLCGLIVVALCAETASAAEFSTAAKSKTVSETSISRVGDQALNLKLAVKSDEVTSKSSSQTKTGKEQPIDTRQATVSVKTSSARTSGGSTSAKPRVLKPLKRRILVFKASWCSACMALNHEWPSMKEVGWRVGEKLTDHIQLVDSDLRPDLVSRYGITALPTLILVDGDKELGRQGSLDARNIAEFYYERLK